MFPPHQYDFFMKTFRKIWSLFLYDQRRSAIVLLGLMLVGMVLETAGVGLVIPVLTLMTQSDIAERFPIIKPFLDGFGNPSQEKLIFIGMMFLILTYTIKVLFLAFLIL